MLYVNPQATPEFRGQALSPGATAREKRALKEFEQLFLFQMLKEMRKTVPDTGLFGDENKRAYFEEMLDDHLAGEMAASGQFGLARQIAAQLDANRGSVSAAADADAAGLAGGGIPYAREAEATGITVNRHASISLRSTRPGLPVETGEDVGVPLKRAHAGYRAHGD